MVYQKLVSQTKKSTAPSCRYTKWWATRLFLWHCSENTVLCVYSLLELYMATISLTGGETFWHKWNLLPVSRNTYKEVIFRGFFKVDFLVCLLRASACRWQFQFYFFIGSFFGYTTCFMCLQPICPMLSPYRISPYQWPPYVMVRVATYIVVPIMAQCNAMGAWSVEV